MSITDLPLFNMLRTRMHWHQERQRLLSENVANADTASFRPGDLAPLDFERASPAPWSVALQPPVASHLPGCPDAGGRFAASLRGANHPHPAENTGSHK